MFPEKEQARGLFEFQLCINYFSLIKPLKKYIFFNSYLNHVGFSYSVFSRKP